MIPVLFISHYSERNGAPLVLLRLLHWLRENTKLKLNVLLRKSGELQPEFEAVASVFVSPRLQPPLSGIVRRAAGMPGVRRFEDMLLRRRVMRESPALVYSNTITNTRELTALAPLSVPTICHVHEMEYWIRHELGMDEALRTRPFIQRYIAAGSAVRDFLVSDLDIDPAMTEIVHDFSFAGPGIPGNVSQLRETTRRELSIDDDTFVVGACGMVEWRKGSDLFVAVARALAQVPGRRKFHFLWVGGPVSGQFFHQLQHDITHSGLRSSISFVGPCQSPARFFAAMDAFLLPSREDTCPLVMLEAAAFGLPIVCFKESGGAPEFVGNDAGLAVPYLDIRRMAQALLALQRSPALRRQLGQVAMKRMKDNHEPDLQCAKIFSAMTHVQPALASGKWN